MDNSLGVFEFARRTGIAVLAGAAGGIVAGLGARLAMRIVADTIGQYPVLTVEGTLLILLIGAIFGVALGAPYGAIQRVLPGRAPAKGLLYGLLLLLLLGLPLLAPPAQGELALAPEALGKGMFGFLFVVYGLSTALCYAALERVLPARTSTAATVSYSLLSITGAASLLFSTLLIARTLLGLLLGLAE